MLRRWPGLLALGLLTLGPGLFWSPAVQHAGEPTGWSAAPLPQQIVDAKSKFSGFSFSLALTALVVLARARLVRVDRFVQPYQTLIKRERLYLVYSKLQVGGG